MATILKGYKFVLFVGVLVGGIGLTLYPIVFKPLMGVDDYKKLRKQIHVGEPKQ